MYPQRKSIFGAKYLDGIFTWVDASYEIHHDMRIHTGGGIYMALDINHLRYSKKKCNTKISTYLELVGASNDVLYNIRYIMFMHHKLYLNKSNAFLWDN